jgi:hypothetical protein
MDMLVDLLASDVLKDGLGQQDYVLAHFVNLLRSRTRQLERLAMLVVKFGAAVACRAPDQRP